MDKIQGAFKWHLIPTKDSLYVVSTDAEPECLIHWLRVIIYDIICIYLIYELCKMWTRYMISKQWVRIVGEQQLVGFPIPGCRVAEGRALCSFFVHLMMIKKKNVRQTSSCKINISLTRQIYLTRRTNTIFNMEWFIFQYWRIDFIIWTNTFDNINKHISKAGQIQLTKLSTTFAI